MRQVLIDRVQALSVDGGQGQQLRVVPILGPSHAQPPYELLRPQTLPFVKVTEVSQAGSVPELLVENTLDVRVFLLDGQELIGAKQNRILNTDVLAPAKTTIKIPVSCVEQGRWNAISACFSAGKTASHRTRSGKSERVHHSLKEHGRHDADQRAVWNEVAESLDIVACASPTSALSDAYRRRNKELTDFRRGLRLPNDAVGLAFFHGASFQGLDLFDRHATLRYFWDSLVDGYALELLQSPVDLAQANTSPEADAIRQILDQGATGKWESFRPPGEGEDWRLEHEQLTGSGLVWEQQVVIHLQLFPKPPARGAEQREATAFRPRIRRRYGFPPGDPRVV